MKLRTRRWPNGEWTAIDDDTYDGAPDGDHMMGWGKTEQEAIDDLDLKLTIKRKFTGEAND